MVQDVVRTGESIVSNIFYSEAIEDYCLTVAAPVYSGPSMAGVLAVTVRYGTGDDPAKAA